jgi:hypothetical protein
VRFFRMQRRLRKVLIGQPRLLLVKNAQRLTNAPPRFLVRQSIAM